MNKPARRAFSWLFGLPLLLIGMTEAIAQDSPQLGREVAIPTHLQDGDEFTIPIWHLIQYGDKLFNAKFTVQEGAGRPLSKGTGAALSDLTSPLIFPNNFDRVSAPEANACSGCHNAPVVGGGGDRVTNVFVLAQRFDHLTFDHSDGITLPGAVDESGAFVTMNTATNDRKPIGMHGSGFLEMVARQMTAELQSERDATASGSSRALTTKRISFGVITRRADGTWDTSRVSGLPAPSLRTSGAQPPSLIILPYHQAGAVVSIRQFTNNAMNHHHGMQSEEALGLVPIPMGTDSKMN